MKIVMGLLAIGVLVSTRALFFRHGGSSVSLERVPGTAIGYAVVLVESGEFGSACRSLVSYSHQSGASRYIENHYTEGPEGGSRLVDAYLIAKMASSCTGTVTTVTLFWS